MFNSCQVNMDKEFRKSSRSGTSCVEVVYRKSSFCGHPGCVEVGGESGNILVRDSKDKNGAVLTFTSDEWVAFVAGVKAGEFDL